MNFAKFLRTPFFTEHFRKTASVISLIKYYSFLAKCFTNWRSLHVPLPWQLMDILQALSINLELLGNMSIVYSPGFILFFLIKPLFYMTKISKQTFNIFWTKRAFKVKNAFFIIFKRLWVTKNCLRPNTTQAVSTLDTNDSTTGCSLTTDHRPIMVLVNNFFAHF